MVQAQGNYKLFPAVKLFLLFLFKSILLSTQVLNMMRTTRHVMIKMSKPKEYTSSPEITKHTQAAKVLTSSLVATRPLCTCARDLKTRAPRQVNLELASLHLGLAIMDLGPS